jgi:fructose-bisphosphate aldolase class II
MGVSKINVNTELQLVFAEATGKYCAEGKHNEGKGYDPRKLLKPGCDAIVAKAIELCEAFGSANKA